MTFILFSKGGYEDEYFKKYPGIIKQRSSTDSVLRTLYTAHFDSRGQLDRFIEGITKDWVVRIWHPLYDIDGGELENSKIKCSEYELAAWLAKRAMYDGSPWDTSFAKRFCNNCPSITRDCPEVGRTKEFSWCELHGGQCKFFPEIMDFPRDEDVIEVWLRQEVEKDG